MADPDLEMGTDNDGEGNVTTPVLETPEIVVDNGNVENSQQDREHASPTAEQLPGNVADSEIGENSKLGIFKLYALSQAGIFAAPSSASKHFKWSQFMLSGLVSTTIIVVLLIQFYQQFRQRQGKEYSTWVAQNAAIVVMLVAMSLCLLISFTP